MSDLFKKQYLEALWSCGMKAEQMATSLYKHCSMLKVPQSLDQCYNDVIDFFERQEGKLKPYEAEIMRQYEAGIERIKIVESIAIDYGLSYNEAEPIVSATILKNTGMVKS